MDTDRVRQIYNDAGKPGARAFRFAARRQGVELTDQEARACVSQQAEGQVFQGRIASNGKIPGGGAKIYDGKWI